MGEKVKFIVVALGAFAFGVAAAVGFGKIVPQAPSMAESAKVIGARFLASRLPERVLRSNKQADLILFGALEADLLDPLNPLATEKLTNLRHGDPDKRTPFCVGVVRPYTNFTTEPPTVPVLIERWVREYYPLADMFKPLPDCVQVQGPAEEFKLKDNLSDGQMVIVEGPTAITDSIMKVTIKHYVPGSSHYGGFTYVMSVTNSGFLLLGRESEFLHCTPVCGLVIRELKPNSASEAK